MQALLELQVRGGAGGGALWVSRLGTLGGWPACAAGALPRFPCLTAAPTCPAPGPPAGSTHVGSDAKHPELCERCLPVINEMGFEAPAPVAAVSA